MCALVNSSVNILKWGGGVSEVEEYHVINISVIMQFITKHCFTAFIPARYLNSGITIIVELYDSSVLFTQPNIMYNYMDTILTMFRVTVDKSRHGNQ